MERMIFVVVGKSESGDDYVAAFDQEPSKEELLDLVRGWDYEELEPGPGFADSYVHIHVEEVRLR